MCVNYFSKTDVEKCSIEVKLDFDKRENFFLLNFYIDGWIELVCDRCSDPFQQEVFGDFEVAIKFSSDENIEVNEDEDIVYISKSDDIIDVSNLIYEFVVLSIPLRSVHPDNENGSSNCNEEVLKKLKIIEEKESTDPRWAVLEKLKNKK